MKKFSLKKPLFLVCKRRIYTLLMFFPFNIYNYLLKWFKMNGKKKFYLLLGFFQIFLVFIVFFSTNGVVQLVSAQTTTLDYYDTGTAGMLGIAAAISVGASTLGSAVAIKTVGTATISSLAEREESFFKAFLVVALAEALAVYGLIVGILLWTKIPSPPG